MLMGRRRRIAQAMASCHRERSSTNSPRAWPSIRGCLCGVRSVAERTILIRSIDPSERSRVRSALPVRWWHTIRYGSGSRTWAARLWGCSTSREEPNPRRQPSNRHEIENTACSAWLWRWVALGPDEQGAESAIALTNDDVLLLGATGNRRCEGPIAPRGDHLRRSSFPALRSRFSGDRLSLGTLRLPYHVQHLTR
jgi:hypothetical protein